MGPIIPLLVSAAVGRLSPMTKSASIGAPATHSRCAHRLDPPGHAGLVDYASMWDRTHDTVIPAKFANPASTGSDPELKRLAGKVLKHQAVSEPLHDVTRQVNRCAQGSDKVNSQTTRQCVARWSSPTTCRAIDGGWA